jgi:tRNA modification GTPase
VRLSGADLASVMASVVKPMGAPLQVGRSQRVTLSDGSGAFDDGLAVLGRGPQTYTGEDTLEVTCHGNPLIVSRLLAAFTACGARIAEPGEFTKRAVVNGKLDLVSAEAVDQICRATTQGGIAIGRAGLDGRIGAFLGRWRRDLVGVAAELEARLDYPADELARVSDAHLVHSLQRASAACRDLADTYSAGRHLVEGARVALVGAVNAGKSSLFNGLLERRRALVHETAGTTRDVLEVPVSICGCAVTLLDTAGERVTEDPIEAAGLALARELVDEADLLLVVLRARLDGPSPVERALLERTSERRRLVVYNGVDVPGCAVAPVGAISTSAVEGWGLDDLRHAIADSLMGESTRADAVMIASARQRDRLIATADAVDEGLESLPIAGIAVAADAVTRGIDELDAMTGADTREDVLDALFARFCIGK